MSSLIDRLQASGWNEHAALLAFILTFGVFAIGTWRAMRMKPKSREHYSALPLDDENTHSTPEPEEEKEKPAEENTPQP